MDIEANRLLVSYDDARTALGGIGRTTLYELIDSGRLVKVNIGGADLLQPKALQRMSIR
jgi:hypothetical protein